MCLILLALDSHPDYALVVAANRDEFYDRPTAPAAFWTETPWVLGGRDLQAGGTWLGVDRRGRFAAVTNYRQGQQEGTAPRSRGSLVRDFLVSETSIDEYMRRVERESGLYNGFNLLAGDPGRGRLRYFSNREGVARTLGPGVYGLSNHLLDTAWPKVTSGKSALQAMVQRGEPELVDALLRLLSDGSRPADHLLPRTGIDEAWERLLSSAFIASDVYGTRSSTVLLIGRNGRLTFVEREFGRRGIPGPERRFEVALTLPTASRQDGGIVTPS